MANDDHTRKQPSADARSGVAESTFQSTRLMVDDDATVPPRASPSPTAAPADEPVAAAAEAPADAAGPGPSLSTLPGADGEHDGIVTRVGRYHVGERLGRGGMASVFKAHDPQLGRDVALKFLHASLCEDAECRTRFLREARAPRAACRTPTS